MTSKVILTNVQVLAAGTKIERDGKDNKPVPVSVVTLLVDPDESERLTLASTEGKIQLALRNPLDKTAPATPGIRPALLAAASRRPVRSCPSARRGTGGPRQVASAKPVAVVAGPSDRRNHSRRQARARSRAPGVVVNADQPSRRHCAVCPPLAFRSRHRRVRRHHAARAAARAGPDRRPRWPCRWPSPSRSHPTRVRLLVGRSTVVDVGTPIARVSLTSADVADAMVTSPSQLLVNGKAPGTISMFVWERAGGVRRYEVTVQRDLAADRPAQAAVPDEADPGPRQRQPSCCPARSPARTSPEKRVNVAPGFVEKKEEVVTLLQVARAAPSNQVLLHVRFAEVSRAALTELGVSLFTEPDRHQEHARPRDDAAVRRAAVRGPAWTKASGDFGTR